MTTTLARRANRARTGLPSILSADPFGALRHDFDQMLSNWFSSEDSAGIQQSFIPSIDLNETDSGYEVKIDLPGIKANEVNVQLSENVLTVSGERKYEKTDGKKNGNTTHCVERYHGSFSRSIVLPGCVKQENIDAQFRDGVLTVSLPKAEDSKPCQITVKS